MRFLCDVLRTPSNYQEIKNHKNIKLQNQLKEIQKRHMHRRRRPYKKMRFRFILLTLIVVNGCAKKPADKGQVMQIDNVDSVETKSLPDSSKDTLSYIGYIGKFGRHGLCYQ